jgi:hypothetical protein
VILGLAAVDYLAWNWSLAHGPELLALICGLALAPLLIALAWLLAVGSARFLADRFGRGRASGLRRGRAPGAGEPAAAVRATPGLPRRRRMAAGMRGTIRSGVRPRVPYAAEGAGRTKKRGASSADKIAA